MRLFILLAFVTTTALTLSLTGTDKTEKDSSTPAPLRQCEVAPKKSPDFPCPLPNTCEECCKPDEECVIFARTCVQTPGKVNCCPPQVFCRKCIYVDDPCKNHKCPSGSECQVLVPDCIPFVCCPSTASCVPTGGYGQ